MSTVCIPANYMEPAFAVSDEVIVEDSMPLYVWASGVNPDEPDLALYGDFDSVITSENKRANMIMETASGVAHEPILTGTIFMQCSEALAQKFLDNDQMFQNHIIIEKKFRAWLHSVEVDTGITMGETAICVLEYLADKVAAAKQHVVNTELREFAEKLGVDEDKVGIIFL